MSTRVVVFPFDLFGGSAAGEGARLLADEIREMVRDAHGETVATRASCWANQLRFRELRLDRLSSITRWRAKGENAARSLSLSQHKVLWLGGNHLSCLPIYDSLSGSNHLILQFDAHLDIHHFQDCIETPSHGNFLLHAQQPLPEVINVGHRDLLMEEKRISQYYRATVNAIEIAKDPGEALRRVTEVSSSRKIWIDIDCDVFDPADFPATGRPIPMGIRPDFLLRVLASIPPENIQGVSFSEFDPARDQNDRCLSLLTWLVEYLLLRWYEKNDPVG